MKILQYTSHFFGTRIMVTAAHRTAPHRTAPHPTHCRVLLSGYPNQEIRWPYLFKGLIIIIVCSYFGDNSAT